MPPTALRATPEHERTPLYVLTGFLGSGKTTLLNSLLRTSAFANTAVIVNEFGEIGLDHHLIASATDNVVLLDSGCLCCALSGSLEETLADLHRRRATGEIKSFARVVIETSGLADPGPILNTLLGHRLVTDFYKLAAMLCTVDVQRVAGQLARHGEARRQIAMADQLLLTKTDLTATMEVARTRELCAGLNPQALCHESKPGEVPLDAFGPAGSPRLHPAYLPAAEHRSDIRAHCFTLDACVTWAGIAAWSRLLSETFGERLLRTKALLRVSDTPGAVFIQGVGCVFHRPERLPVWPSTDPRGHIVCIVQNVQAEALRQCLAALTVEAGVDARFTLGDLQVAWPAQIENR
ncbi:MAG: CobW family GTP-binding protein [Burkholderiales bacterium]